MYRVFHLLVDWVGLTGILTVPLSAQFCLGRWEFGRSNWEAGQNPHTKEQIAHLEPRGALRVDDADLLANVEAVSGVDGPHVVASRASEAYRTEATVGGGSVARRGNL